MKSFLASLSLLLCATLATAADFDWKTRFPQGLVDEAGKTVDLASLKGKTSPGKYLQAWQVGKDLKPKLIVPSVIPGEPKK